MDYSDFILATDASYVVGLILSSLIIVSVLIFLLNIIIRSEALTGIGMICLVVGFVSIGTVSVTRGIDEKNQYAQITQDKVSELYGLELTDDEVKGLLYKISSNDFFSQSERQIDGPNILLTTPDGVVREVSLISQKGKVMLFDKENMVEFEHKPNEDLDW